MNRRQALTLLGAGGGLGALGLVGGTAALTSMFGSGPKGIDLAGGPCLTGAGDASVDGLDAVQLRNIATVVGVGIELKIPTRGLIVAVATLMQECGGYNLASRANPGSLAFPHDGVAAGDHDSVGMFQQRDAWGPLSVRMDPAASARMFFLGGMRGQRGLTGVPGWEAMTIWQAAQAVQVSAFPQAYAKHEPIAAAAVAAVTGATGVCAPSTSCAPTDLGAEKGLTPDALNVLRCGVAFSGITIVGGVAPRPDNPESDHPKGRAVDFMVPRWKTPAGRAAGWELAEYMRSRQADLGITYVIFDAKSWSAGGDAWGPYDHPSGRGGPTRLHLDHVHVSVSGTSGLLVTGGNA